MCHRNICTHIVSIMVSFAFAKKQHEFFNKIRLSDTRSFFVQSNINCLINCRFLGNLHFIYQIVTND